MKGFRKPRLEFSQEMQEYQSYMNDTNPIRDQVIEALKTIEDPELFLDIWFLGLIYRIDIVDGLADIDMTFTSPMCPVGPQLVEQVKQKVGAVPGISSVNVTIVFRPMWQPSDEVKALLGLI